MCVGDVYAHVRTGACRGQKRELDILETELHTIIGLLHVCAGNGTQVF